ncbi:uncharacterized protein EI97DRAFT_455998 [Westerdykella ornata]|uniref:Uncharacterized protein n=1 Tax=Westerdykella ornata TaxID=318751 RepID=A0A6A6JT65_WESOR|nr:uncharacterized protein EI97DRAFT_455998 [Westerdykella ornata]KAF2279801.1 hypothetical protein EI97DRAFT_455998 [Westerdykella ornata]
MSDAKEGTPNSVGIGYFLMQPKMEHDHCQIYAARAFYCDSRHKAPCLLYYIQDKWFDEVPHIR